MTAPLRLRIFDLSAQKLYAKRRLEESPFTVIYRIYQCRSDENLSALGVVYNEFARASPFRYAPAKMDAFLDRMGFSFHETLTLYGKNRSRLHTVEKF